jgi:hypothetical protein
MGPVRAGLAGSLLLLVLVVLLVGGISWIGHAISREGQLEARFAPVIWEVPIAAWADNPVDVSERICPLVDPELRAEVEREESWRITVGNCLFGGERVLGIAFDEGGRCTAMVDMPPPSCSL